MQSGGPQRPDVCYNAAAIFGDADDNSPFSIKYSAICTALVAAPLRRLSLTIHIFKVLGWLSSLLNLPTSTSSLSCASIGIGYCCLEGSSTSTTPGDWLNNFFTSSKSKSFSNSTFTLSL